MEILFFTGPTCAPCKMLKPIVQDLQAQFKFKVKLIEAGPKTQKRFEEFNVRAVPTMVAIDEEGNELGRLTGMIAPASLRGWLMTHKFIPQWAT